MQKQFEIILKLRTWLIDFTNDLSVEELNTIPAGFNNNIAWNLAHLVSTQQNLCYRMSNVPAVVDDAFIDRFKPGTKPEGDMTAAEIDGVRRLLISLVNRMEDDYNKGVFTSYNLFKNRYGIDINSTEDAIKLVVMHEGLHTGYIMALKRTVRMR